MYPSLHTRLLHQHETIFALTEDISDADLAHAWQPGKWSMQDNMAHLGCYQRHFRRRVQRILQEDNPALARYVAEEDPAFAEWQSMSRQQLQEHIQKDRTELIRFLQNVAQADWNRTGTHPKLGVLSLTHWLEFFLMHEAHHLYTIFRLRAYT